MAIEFYDVSVKIYLQLAGQSVAILKKAKDHLGADKANELLNFRLAENMLPLTFQVNSIRHHSLGALNGIKKGEFSPPPPFPELDFDGVIQFLEDTVSELEALSPEEVNALQDKSLIFKMANTETPFTAESFLTSFSLPNFTFHATTLYNIFRHNGVPLGKIDFLGRLVKKP